MRIKFQDAYQWHEYFAILPRTLKYDHVVVWWEVAMRRKKYTGYSRDCCDNGRDYTWEYKLKEKE